MNINEFNETMCKNMDILIKREMVAQMLAKDQKKNENVWEVERRRRYEYLNRFRNGGGIFDIACIINEKEGRLAMERYRRKKGEGKSQNFLTKFKKRKADPITALPSIEVLEKFDISDMSINSATKVGLSLFLADAKYLLKNQEEPSPHLYIASDDESRYDTIDGEEKDKIAIGDEAKINAKVKLRDAEKISEINKLLGREKKTSSLVKYFK